MGALRLAGALWIMAGVTCAGLFTFVFVGENLNDLGALLENPALPALALGGAIVALWIGGLQLTRPESGVVRWSKPRRRRVADRLRIACRGGAGRG